MVITDIKEIRKRIEPELENFKSVYGCYVNAAGEIVSTMEIPVLDMQHEERAQYAALLKKTIAGSFGKNLRVLSFSTDQVEKSDEHGLLTALKNSHLENEELRDLFYENVVACLDMEGKSYVILLAADTYDIPSRESDEEWSEESDVQFDYFLCGICPVKEPKAELKYMPDPQAFRGSSTGSLLSAPIIGFMFPGFEDKQANLYEFPYYTKSSKESHEELIEDFFKISKYPLADEQIKTAFNEILAESLSDECTVDLITRVQANIAAKIEDTVSEDSLMSPDISIKEIGDILIDKGVSEEKVSSFTKEAEDAFGTDTLNANALIQKSDYKITSSEANITVDPNQAIRIKTKTIDGVTYFLVPVGADVKVNGISISGYGE